MRQSRQQADLSGMALQQHLSYACGSSEIPVDLERRMVVEQVRQRGLAQQRDQVLVGEVSFLEPVPEIDDPRAAPACPAAAVFETPLERSSGRLRQLGCSAQRDLIAGVQREQV